MSASIEPPVSATDVPAEDLVSALRAGVRGTLTEEAAVELLLEQGTWPTVPAFLRRFVEYHTDPAVVGDSGPMAFVKWAAAVTALENGSLPPVGSAADSILRVAASFAAGVPIKLNLVVTNSLGRAHAAMVVKTVKHATGLDDQRAEPPTQPDD